MTRDELSEMKFKEGLSFSGYMRGVDKVLNAICGLSHNDLADCAWRDDYEVYQECGSDGIDVLETAAQNNPELWDLVD